MLAIIITILFFGITILIHEFGHFVVAKICNIQVNEFSLGMGPSLFHRKKGETLYSVRALPIGGYVAMEGEEESSNNPRSFDKKPVYQRIAVILAGAFMNILLGMLLVGIVLAVQGKVQTTQIDKITTGAIQGQLYEGDVIKKMNGKNILNASDLSFQLQRMKENEPISLTVSRNNEMVTIQQVPYQRIDSNGVSINRIGIQLKVVPLSITNFFPTLVQNSVYYTKVVCYSLADLVTGKVALNQLSGPVGVTKAVSQAKNEGWIFVLSLFSFLTINIGIFNLIPFPALDGGQFVLLLIEGIFRRPVNKKIQTAINSAGLILLLLLMVVITVKDVINLF